MANRTDTEREEIRKIIKDSIEANGVPSTLGMQEYLAGLGYGVSTGTIASIYKELGFTPKRQPSFMWKKSEGKGE